MADIIQRLIAIAQAEVGYHEGKSGSHWNNIEKYAAQVPGMAWVSSTGQPWCDLFVHWIFEEGGVLDLLPDVGPGAPGGSASCDVSRSAWRKVGRYSEYPAIGAQVFYGTPADSNHTGFVVKYDDTYIWAVEGNTNTTGAVEGDGVYLKQRLRRSTNVLGYGYPDYAGGIKSADPAWANGFKPGTTAGIGKRVDFVDLSHHNAGISAQDFKTGKSAGVRGVFHKATQGTTFVDPDYGTRRGYARDAGQRFGAYHYLDTSNVAAQMAHFLKVAKPKEGDLRPALDFEHPDFASWSAAKKTAFIGEAVAILKKEVGVLPYIYTRWDLTDNFGCMLWVARYHPQNAAPAIPKPWKGWRIDQFSDGATGVPNLVAGFGKVDLDTILEGPTESINWHLIPAVTVPVPPPPPQKPGTKTVLHMTKRDVLPHGSSDHNPVVWHFVTSGGAVFYTGQANIQGTDPTDVADKTIDTLLDAAALWTLNEVTTLALQQHVDGLVGWGSYMDHAKRDASGKIIDKADEDAVTIIWREDTWEFIKGYTTVLHKGFSGFTPIRVVKRVLLKHKATGEYIWRQATQTVHHVEVNGKARVTGALTGQNARAKASFPKIVDDLYAAVRELIPGMAVPLTAPLFGSGDLNVDYDSDRAHALKGDATPWFPYTVFGPHADIIDTNDGLPTHGSRKIDWGWLRQAV